MQRQLLLASQTDAARARGDHGVLARPSLEPNSSSAEGDLQRSIFFDGEKSSPYPSMRANAVRSHTVENWTYMKANVPEITYESMSTMPKQHSDFYKHMRLLRRREVQFNPHFKGAVRFDPKWPHNPLALAVYLTGKVPPTSCSRCTGRGGPFVGCVMPADEIWDSIRVKSCANDIYNWQSSKCNLNPSFSKRTAGHSNSSQSMTNFYVAVPIRSRASPAPSESAASTRTLGRSVTPETQAAYWELQSSALKAAISAEAQNGDAVDALADLPRPDAQKFRAVVSQFSRDHQSTAAKPPTLSGEGITRDDHAVSLVFQSDNQGEDAVLAQPIIDLTTGVYRLPGDIAFSSGLLKRDGEHKVVHEGVELHITEVLQGEKQSWAARADSVRLCIVSAGSLAVEVEHREFSIGVDSAFKIREGKDCVVENLFADTAVVYILTMESRRGGEASQVKAEPKS